MTAVRAGHYRWRWLTVTWSAVTATTLVGVAGSACSSGPSAGGRGDTGGSGEGCAFVAVWHGIKYTDVLFRYQQQHLTSSDILRPERPGRFLGTAKVPGCADGDATGEPVRVYVIPGVAPTVAVMTTDRQIGVADGRAIPDQLIRKG